MSLSRNLYYYDSGWQDISKYVTAITPIKYEIDNRIQGASSMLAVEIDSYCSHYGTGKYKLAIGSNYTLLGAPADGIENIGNKKIRITLVDYLFYKLADKVPLKVGSNNTLALAGEFIKVIALNELKTEYKTAQGSFDADGFSSRDRDYFYDGLGNTIEVDENDIRYKTKGVLYGDNTSSGERGTEYVSIRDIINNIITAEGFTLDVDYGYEEDGFYDGNTNLLNYKKVWDAVPILKGDNLFIITLYSKVGECYLRSHDADLPLTIDDLKLDNSRDWDSGSNGIDIIPYRIFPDYYNEKVYIACWYCSSYVHDDPSNAYTFRVYKIDIASDGTLSKDYTDDYTGVELWTKNEDPANRSDYDDRSNRFLNYLTDYDNTTWYNDETLAENNKFRIILRESANLHVIDPDRHQASQADWKYTYSLTVNHGWIVPDWMNGAIAHIFYNSGTTYYEKDFYKVNIETLSAAYAISGRGGRIHSRDNPSNNDVPPLAVWRESIYYKNSFSTSTGHKYHTPQVPNGVLYKDGVYNLYTLEEEDYFSLYYDYDKNPAGTAWDNKNDIALWWYTNPDTDPTAIYWDVKQHYTYKRLHLYQNYAYVDRKQQLMDVLVASGFFYEQIDGNVRLFRIRGSGTSIGTFTDDDLLLKNEIDGYTNFAEEYSINVLTKKISKGSGSQVKEIKTKIGDYGWMSTYQADFYSDWTNRINTSNAGIELSLDMEAFYSVTSTYIPNLGKTFTYDSNTYILIGVEIDIENWIIKIKGIKDV